MKCADFVGMLFLARDVAHSVHLNTRSYSKHKALGKFYDEIIDLADKFAEAYQGRHGLIGPISLMSASKKLGMKCVISLKHRCKTSLMKLLGCT